MDHFNTHAQNCAQILDQTISVCFRSLFCRYTQSDNPLKNSKIQWILKDHFFFQMVFENLAVEVFLYTQASSPVNNRHKKKFTHQIEKEKH